MGNDGTALLLVLPRQDLLIDYGSRWSLPLGWIKHAGDYFDQRLAELIWQDRSLFLPPLNQRGMREEMTAIADEGDHGPQAPDVGKEGVVLKVVDDFRCHVDLCPTFGLSIVAALSISGQQFSESKVSQLPGYPSGWSHTKDVIRLQVSVHDVGLLVVKVVEGSGKMAN